MAYVEMYSWWVAGTSEEWEEKDLSGAPWFIPANAILELYMQHGSATGPSGIGARTRGSGQDRKISIHESEGAGKPGLTLRVVADGNSVIETYIQGTVHTQCRIHLMGYWTTGSYVELAPTLFYGTANNTWQRLAIDTAHNQGSAVTDVVLLNANSGQENVIGVRQPSGTARTWQLHESEPPDTGAYTALGVFTQPNGTGVEIFTQDYGSTAFAVMGYWKTNPEDNYVETFYQVPPNAATGVWEEEDLTSEIEDGATLEMVSYQNKTNNALYAGCREKGSPNDRYPVLHEAEGAGEVHYSSHVNSSATGSVETKVSHATQTGHYLAGYWYSSAITQKSTDDHISLKDRISIDKPTLPLDDHVSFSDDISIDKPTLPIDDHITFRDDISVEVAIPIDDHITLRDDISIVAEVPIDDHVSLRDSITIDKTVLPIDDHISLSDSISIEVQLPLDDHITFRDDVSISKTVPKSEDDHISFSDAITIDKTVLPIDDHISFSETISIDKEITIDDHITFRDDISVSGASFDIDDHVSFSESVSINKTVLPIDDHISFSDAITIDKTILPIDDHISLRDDIEVEATIPTDDHISFSDDIGVEVQIAVDDHVSFSDAIALPSKEVGVDDHITFSDDVLKETPGGFVPASMNKWRVWEGSTQIQTDVRFVNIFAKANAMWDCDIELKDPDDSKTWLDYGSAMNVFEGGIPVLGEHAGTGNGITTLFTFDHGTLQGMYVKLYVDGTGPGEEIDYNRLGTVFDTGAVLFRGITTVQAGSSLFVDYIYGGTALFRGELENVEINAEWNQKAVTLTGRCNLLDANYTSLDSGSFRMGWTSVVDENVGDGDGTTATFNLDFGSVAEDSLVLYAGSLDGAVYVGTAQVASSRIMSVSFANGTVNFYSGNTLADGSTLFADYVYGSGSAIEDLVKKVCDKVGLSYDGTSIPATGVTAMCDARDLSGFDAFQKLREMCGSTYEANFWLDPEDKLFYFRDAESGGTHFEQINMIPTHNYIGDATDKYGKVVYHYQDDKYSITKGSGSKVLHIHDPYTKYYAEALDKARRFFAVNATARESGNFMVRGWSTVEKLGDIIRVTDAATGQAQGSATLTGIHRHWSTEYRKGQLTYEYGETPVEFTNIFKQERSISNYREKAIDMDKRYTTTLPDAHNSMSGLQGGQASPAQRYHFTATQHSKLVNTYEETIYHEIRNYSADPRGFDWWSWISDQSGGFNFEVPRNYASGSFHIEAITILSGGAGTAVMRVDEEHIPYSAGTASEYGDASRTGTYVLGPDFQTDFGTSQWYYYHDWGDIGTYSVAIGDVIRVRVYRNTGDDADSAGNDWKLLGIRLTYTANPIYN